MKLKEQVGNQVAFVGKSPGGCKLVLKDLLDGGRDVLQFMQLFSEQTIEHFYAEHQEEIQGLYAENPELLDGTISDERVGTGLRATTRLALEKTLIVIENELKNEFR